jgi:hypothetical protein
MVLLHLSGLKIGLENLPRFGQIIEYSYYWRQNQEGFV